MPDLEPSDQINYLGVRFQLREHEAPNPHAGDELVITKGIKAQEQIVTSANFMIDSEAQLQAAAGAFVPPPPGAGQAASMNAPAQPQANVELTTDPDLHRKATTPFA